MLSRWDVTLVFHIQVMKSWYKRVKLIKFPFFFLSLLVSGQTECMKNIMTDLNHYAAAFQSYLKAPLRNPDREAALLSPAVEMIQSLRKVRVFMCAWVSQRGGVMIWDRKWENILGNNILVSPDQSFLGFYRAAPCQRKGKPPLRYGFLGILLLLTERGAIIPPCFLPGGCCPDVGQWHLQQQAGDVPDVEGLLHPDHHHQQSPGLHLLRRPQEVIGGQV